MCIAIYKPEGQVLTQETLQNCWNANSDGAGFMYHQDNKLHVVKGLMTFKDFEEAYKPFETIETVLHFRIKTHGATNQENTHPFLVDNNLGVVHNGIISNVDTKSKPEMSDTWHFTERHLFQFRQSEPKFFLNPMYKDVIESYIGYSKLIFMDAEGNVEIFNEQKGIWDSKCWFSNSSYKPYVPPKQSKFDYTKTKPDTKVTPSPWSKKANGYRPFVAGDWACTTTDIKGDIGVIPKGSLVVIKHFKQNNVVTVYDTSSLISGDCYLSQLNDEDIWQGTMDSGVYIL